MEIVITQWGLDSYLKLRHEQVFSGEEYWGTIRPDVLRLSNYPADPKFQAGKFWSPATDGNGSIPGGFKMKWHQVGPGSDQLRVPVFVRGDAYLCGAYIKHGPQDDRRYLAHFKTHIEKIAEGDFHICGRLT